ncbi:MAG: DUF1570 domain-containing protein [Planctomycetaceae bacterium]|nr:DUF1570 domain-containing protein [Planctomycetaceae bacterium]
MNGCCRWRVTLSVIMMLGVFRGGSLLAQRVSVDDYQQRFQEQRELFILNGEQFAESLQSAGQDKYAQHITRQLELLNDSSRVHMPLAKSARPEISPVATPETVWLNRWRRLKDQHAAEMFTLSQQVLRQKYIGLSYRIARYVLQVNSDHAEARKMLGYVRDENEWMTPFEKLKKEDGEIWDDRFGWIEEADLPKYEQGLRPFKNRWITIEQDRNLRLSSDDLWEVRTEHWVIRTDHSLEKGVEVAGKLEDFFQFFVREFPDLFASRGQMNQLFNIGFNGRARVNKNPMQVNYFSSRDGYINRLRDAGPLIGSTNGIYLNRHKTSYFYNRPENSEEEESTIYHEATHQILFESRSGAREVAQEMHFWVIEGFACYMESYRNQDGVVSIGDPNFIRFNNAMVRLVVDRYFVGLEQFTSLGQNEFQRQPELPKLYSQASGVVHFFIHAHDGAYRDDFGKFLAAIYSPQLRSERHVPTLNDLTGKSYRELDAEYVRYIAQLAEEVALAEDQD